jgi:ribonuclease BN (tRNA processing enzyme)
MGNNAKGISRRQFLTGSAAIGLGSLLSKNVFAKSKQSGLSQKSGTRLILLGTGGGPHQNRMRSQSSWVVLVNDTPYVVDCGQGVARQLVYADVPLQNLRYIFITHHHSDHNLDYGNLIYDAWVSGCKGRIDCYGPPPLERMTKLYFEMNAYDINIRIPDEGRIPFTQKIFVHESSEDGVVLQNESVKVTAALVHHPPVEPSFAYRFDTPDRSIVFSGDTTPCDNLIKLAQGADVLIHEVLHKPSLTRAMARVANADRLIEHIVAAHTTHIDVGKVAKAAGVKALVLTHFVPSDDSLLTDEIWIEGAKTRFNGEVVAGKDLMEI